MHPTLHTDRAGSAAVRYIQLHQVKGEWHKEGAGEEDRVKEGAGEEDRVRE